MKVGCISILEMALTGKVSFCITFIMLPNPPEVPAVLRYYSLFVCAHSQKSCLKLPAVNSLNSFKMHICLCQDVQKKFHLAVCVKPTELHVLVISSLSASYCVILINSLNKDINNTFMSGISIMSFQGYDAVSIKIKLLADCS